jgi:uncharacterized membrane protein YphA (DoxX/SURF4 family)
MTKRFTKPEVAPVVLRLALAAIILSHGALKVAYSQWSWHPSLSPEVQMAVAWGEIACGAALLLGLLSQVAALGTIVIQAGAIALETWKLGFQDVQAGTTTQGFNAIGAGWEFNFAIIMMCVALLFTGSGPLSVDGYLWRKKAAGAGNVPAPAPAGVR